MKRGKEKKRKGERRRLIRRTGEERGEKGKPEKEGGGEML